jgi:hypothetical protein
LQATAAIAPIRHCRTASPNDEETNVALILLLALIALILFGVGFTAHVLWIVAVVLALVWLIGFAVRPGGKRWYYW